MATSDENDGLAEAKRRIQAVAKAGETSLDLSGLGLTTLPPEIGSLTALQNLDLNSNRLTTLPPEIGSLTGLQTLDLIRNELRALPSVIGSLAALQELLLNGNEQIALPSAMRSLTSLKRLYLHDIKAGIFPTIICSLTGLEVLYFGGNRITTLPREIGSLTALRILYLRNNRLTALRPEIGSLTALQELYLGGNQLATLPPEIGKCRELKRLVLEENDLRELPGSLLGLSSLRVLALHENTKLQLAAELLGPKYQYSQPKGDYANPRALLDHYFARQEQGEAPMQEVRVLLIGRGRVGKTSLLKALDRKRPDANEPETPGITVKRFDINCERGKAVGHFWDFGGQEFLHGTHQIFLGERCIYVLVLEGRESNWETESDYWIRFIQSFGGQSPVIVALNKYDLHKFTVDRHRLMERCPQIIGFVQTDAMSGRGVGELRSLLEKTVAGMKEVWLGVPRRWHRIKEELESMPESFLEFDQFRELCAKNGVTDGGQQESLAITLHQLGVALNFRDHHRLQHTSVLKPQWVTEAIYGLIRFTQTKDCHGVMRIDWLPEALQPAKDYPPRMHQFVVDLMAKFEVAFPLENAREGRWLIPELLGEEQPDAFAQFRGADANRLRFSYPEALPPGLLPRLIVRTHEMSEPHPQWRWRSGMVLEWFASKALVRLDRLQRRTEVDVLEGPLADQQSLFDIIRAHLVVLNGNVKVIEETQIEGLAGAWVRVSKLRRKEFEGVREIEEETDEDEPVMVKVSEALDKVESDAATKAVSPDPPQRLRLFISYAHDNEKELFPFRHHLTLLGQEGYIQVWRDRDLVAGEKWETGILEELNRADIVLLFYTIQAKVSKFIQEKELPISLERSDAGKCSIIWVPLERKDLKDDHPLEKRLKALQCGTADAATIYSFQPHALGWLQVEEAIRKAVEKRRAMSAKRG